MVIMKYQESVVYMIKSSVTNYVFVSSTTQKLSQRMKTLKRNHREYQAGMRKFTAVYQIMDAGDYTYKILQEVKCESKVTLRKTEQAWISRMLADDSVHVLQQLNPKLSECRRHPCANDINLLRAPCCEFIDIMNKLLAANDKTMTIACIEEMCYDVGLDMLMSKDIVSFICDVHGGTSQNLKNRLAKNIRTPFQKLAVLGKKYDELPKDECG
jgi:hypothetical protein